MPSRINWRPSVLPCCAVVPCHICRFCPWNLFRNAALKDRVSLKLLSQWLSLLWIWFHWWVAIEERHWQTRVSPVEALNLGMGLEHFLCEQNLGSLFSLETLGGAQLPGAFCCMMEGQETMDISWRPGLRRNRQCTRLHRVCSDSVLGGFQDQAQYPEQPSLTPQLAWLWLAACSMDLPELPHGSPKGWELHSNWQLISCPLWTLPLPYTIPRVCSAIGSTVRSQIIVFWGGMAA